MQASDLSLGQNVCFKGKSGRVEHGVVDAVYRNRAKIILSNPVDVTTSYMRLNELYTNEDEANATT